MDLGGGYIKLRQTRATGGCMVAQVKVREYYISEPFLYLLPFYNTACNNARYDFVGKGKVKCKGT